jgi:predicted DCC family thiol-disulfide oxidoreductase YuxK
MGTVHVLYDAECGFCRWSVVQLLRWDARGRRVLEPIAIQSDEGARLLAAVPEAARLKTAHVVGPDGVVHSGGDAAAVVADVLPAGAPLAFVSRLLPWLVRGGYGLVAGNRMRVSRIVPAGAKQRADAMLAARQP